MILLRTTANAWAPQLVDSICTRLHLLIVLYCSEALIFRWRIFRDKLLQGTDGGLTIWLTEISHRISLLYHDISWHGSLVTVASRVFCEGRWQSHTMQAGFYTVIGETLESVTDLENQFDLHARWGCNCMEDALACVYLILDL